MEHHLDTVLTLVPVWLLITVLIGAINGSLFFLVAGRRPRSLLPYVAISMAFATMAQLSGLVAAGEPPLSLGDVQLVAASLASWIALSIARAAGV